MPPPARWRGLRRSDGDLAIGDALDGAPTLLRTLVLATAAVPIVVYGPMPQLHRARGTLIVRRRNR
ncbi:hypothetical protein [Aeromicrobium sp. NPDC092404]|uniref:hypothetical protein n=1 Tax=Aeromicrobium sp. NPDC092404 TaxID=3154976 RepID=UPI00341E1BE4